jgi:DNA-binding PadR family transcriptional regulator
MSTTRDPQAALPLTAVAFEILLSLAEEDRHGYHIMQAVEHRTGGRVTLHAGTLYRALARLVEAGMIEELDERPDPRSDERRRYYRLTEYGRDVAEAEAARLDSQVRAARSLRILRRSER